MIDINWHPTNRQLRQFGSAFLVASLVLGAVLWSKTGMNVISSVLWVTGPMVAFVGWFTPPVLKPLFIALTLIAYPIGMVVGTLTLAFAYYLIVTPIGLIFRVFGRDSLHRGLEPEANTYWASRQTKRSAASYFRQF